jgi:hypothetical protein
MIAMWIDYSNSYEKLLVLYIMSLNFVSTEFIIIPTPLCPKACRTLNFLTVQENRALAGRVKKPIPAIKEKHQ